jgi:Glycosyltransferase
VAKEVVVMYRDHVLPLSETFILGQGSNLTDYDVYYAGYRKVSGIETPGNRTFVVNKKRGTRIGRIRESLFIRYGISPHFLMKFLLIKPKFIHVQFGVSATTILPFAKKLRVPIIVTYHGYDATIRDEVAATASFCQSKYIERRESLIEYADQFIAVSNYIKKKMIDQGIPENKIIVHHIGIDLKKFIHDPSIVREPIVLFVARLVEKKGCIYLLKAMKKVQQLYPDYRLVIIGDGPLKSNLEEYAQAHNINCEFLGGRSHEYVKQWMNKSKIFSVPSITAETGDAEGFGMVFAEANAMGLPVVSFRSGGVPEAVEHNVTGLLVEEKDSDGLAESIIRLLSDSALWQQMSKSGIARVREQFDIEKQTLKLQEIYKKTFPNK